MRSATILLAGLLVSTFAVGCDSDKKADDKKADDKKTDDKKADGDKVDAKADDKADAAGGDVELPKIGLKGAAPAGAAVSEMMGMDMVNGGGLTATVEAGDDKPATGDAAKEDADMYGPENANVETLDDGYVFTFTNKGGMGENFWVQSRREIDGKAVWCSTTASTKEQQDAAVAFCKSLHK
jgi:hypothetical protein